MVILFSYWKKLYIILLQVPIKTLNLTVEFQDKQIQLIVPSHSSLNFINLLPSNLYFYAFLNVDMAIE